MVKNTYTELDKEELRSLLEHELPPIVARAEVSKYLGGYYSSGTLANEDSRGTGPKHPIYGEGGKVAYMKPHFIDWVLSKTTIKKIAVE